MLGSHLIRSYSKTQSIVAKSSGESELYGIIRASTEGLGIVTLLGDFGVKDAVVSIGIDATAAMGMAQRVGLNKVRHVEVDVLWIQEQQARKLLPLRKIPGPRNPSDLCTKNVPTALLEQYLQQLSVRIVEGRAAVAQQLHILRSRNTVRASGEVGAQLTPVIGGRIGIRARASLASGDPATGPSRVVGGPDRNRKKAKKRSPEERCVDSWEVAGEGGRWVREHRTPRRALFTPHRVAGGPTVEDCSNTRRITKGVYIRDGMKFEIVDDYSVEDAAHKVLEGAWTGVTEFNFIVPEVKKKKIVWADIDVSSDEITTAPTTTGHSHEAPPGALSFLGLSRQSCFVTVSAGPRYLDECSGRNRGECSESAGTCGSGRIWASAVLPGCTHSAYDLLRRRPCGRWRGGVTGCHRQIGTYSQSGVERSAQADRSVHTYGLGCYEMSRGPRPVAQGETVEKRCLLFTRSLGSRC